MATTKGRQPVSNRQDHATSQPTNSIGWALPAASLLLSLAGIGISIYLTIEHFTGNGSLLCSNIAGVSCLKVTTSPQSLVFGVIPVAVLGLAFFVPMTVINLPQMWNTSDWRIPWIRLGLCIVGVGTAVYLLYAELFQIRAICLWCTGVHVITFIIFLMVVFSFPTVTSRPARLDA